MKSRYEYHTMKKTGESMNNGLRLEFDSANRPPIFSCLYHTFKILLYRPMLTRRRNMPEDEPTPVHSYLVHCVTSATSIIAIFNLFVRNFSTDFCVLSLSYTLYIAATIYLLQVQAFPDDQQALQRLDFCIRNLNEVKKYCPSTFYGTLLLPTPYYSEG